MPKALNADWNLAQALYVQGVNYATIAEKVGVTEAALRQRAHRHGWPALKTASVTMASQAVTGSAKTLVQRSESVRENLGEEVEEAVGALREVPVKRELAHLDERADVAGKLVTSAAKVFGWENDQQGCLVNVAVLALGIEAESHALSGSA